MSLVTLQDEVEEIVEYAWTHLNITCPEYRKVWYKLHSYCDAQKWTNIAFVSFYLVCYSQMEESSRYFLTEGPEDYWENEHAR